MPQRSLHDTIAAALARLDRFGMDEPMSAEEEQILACLGAAVVSEWNGLPRDVQRRIFERASSLGEPVARFGLRQELATFLHDHHERTAPAGGSRE
ncbi:MAG: hypothetical protein JWN93_2887 [Hyphomicrobiales bacterium]|nr:hypothetical protein [Hyphomicrobiales bacterium]